MENSRGRVNKIEEKTEFQGGQCKKMENSRGGHGKFDWISRGVTSKNRYLRQRRGSV